MTDISRNLFSALPQAYDAAGRTAPSVSLIPPAENLQGANSLRTVAATLDPAGAIPNRQPRDPRQSGFASLGPVLQTVGNTPDLLAAAEGETSELLWRQLLEQGSRNAELRQKRHAELLERQEKARETYREAQAEQEQAAEQARQTETAQRGEVADRVPQDLPPSRTDDTARTPEPQRATEDPASREAVQQDRNSAMAGNPDTGIEASQQPARRPHQTTQPGAGIDLFA